MTKNKTASALSRVDEFRQSLEDIQAMAESVAAISKELQNEFTGIASALGTELQEEKDLLKSILKQGVSIDRCLTDEEYLRFIKLAEKIMGGKYDIQKGTGHE